MHRFLLVLSGQPDLLLAGHFAQRNREESMTIIYRPATRLRAAVPRCAPGPCATNASPFAHLAAVPRSSMRFPATVYVVSLAMVRSSGRLPPPFDRQ